MLTAHRGGIRTVLIPVENKRELTEKPKNIKQDLDIKPVKWIDEVFQLALQHMPKPLVAPSPAAVPAETEEKKAVKPKKGQDIRPHRCLHATNTGVYRRPFFYVIDVCMHHDVHSHCTITHAHCNSAEDSTRLTRRFSCLCGWLGCFFCVLLLVCFFVAMRKKEGNELKTKKGRKE